jgi:molybdate transport system substrate-binding protein
MARNVSRGKQHSENTTLMRSALLVALALWFLTACANLPFGLTPTALPIPTASTPLHIYADETLAYVLRDIGTAFVQANPGTQIQWHFAAPEMLRGQIANDSQAALVMTADTGLLDWLARSGRASAPMPIASDPLAILVANANPAQLERAEDLNRNDLRVAIAKETTALGRATRALVENFRHDAAFGPDFPNLFYQSVRVQADSGRAVLNALIANDADVGIAFASEANLERNRIKILPMPEGLDEFATSTSVILQPARLHPSLQAWVEYLDSPQAQTLWRDYGFEPK